MTTFEAPSAAAPLRGDDLLLFLEAVVQGDEAVPGLRGVIGFAVQTDDVESWIRIDFGAKAKVQRVPARPSKLDAWMVLDDATANRFLGRPEKRAGRKPRFGGQAKIMTRFVERYIERRSMVDVRVGLRRQ